MGNTPSKDEENEKKNLILLDDNFLHSFQKKNNVTIERKFNNLEKDNSNLYKNNELTELYESSNSDKSISSVGYEDNKDYYKLRKTIIDDLIKESEKYINEHKGKLSNVSKNSFKTIQTNSECLYDENNIYDCLKNMNESTSDFINAYTRCYRYLRKYENCVQKIKI